MCPEAQRKEWRERQWFRKLTWKSKNKRNTELFWVACSENLFISFKKFLPRSCQDCPQFSARICGIAVGKCVDVFTEMFKAVEVWILHNSIKMCILVITESEKKYKASLRKGVGKLRTACPLWVNLLGNSGVSMLMPSSWWVSSEWPSVINPILLWRTHHLWKDKQDVISSLFPKEMVYVGRGFCSINDWWGLHFDG